MTSLKIKTGLFVAITIVFIHFMFFNIGGFPLTIALLSISFFILYHYRITIGSVKLFSLLLFIIWPIITLVFYKKFVGQADTFSFLTTYSLWIVASFSIFFSLSSRVSKFINYSNTYKVTIIFIVVFSLMQVYFFRLFDSSVFYNPFGSFTYFGGYDLDNITAINIPRAYGFYLEPSFNAFVVFSLATLYFLCNPEKGYFSVIIFSMIGIVVSASASGILISTVLFGLFFLLRFINNNLLRTSTLFLMPFLLILISLIVLEGLVGRFSEVNSEGTSGYWRLVAPLIILRESLSLMPLGMPLGTVNEFVLGLGLRHGGSTGSSLDNGLAILVYYFGFVAILFSFYSVIRLFVSFYRRDTIRVVFWWYVFSSLHFSGGVFLPEYVFFMVLVSYQYKYSMHDISVKKLR